MATSTPLTITLEQQHDEAQVDRANASGRPPIVFVHGLWLLPSSWNRWAEVFEAAGFSALAPGWPNDPETVDEAVAHPEAFAGKTIGQIADHFAEVIGKLNQKPAIVGHSVGGLLTQILAGRGLSAASDTYAVPGSGAPIFQAATANLNPWTEDQVDTTNPERGPLLIISGEKDNTVPWAIANASFDRQKRNPGVTEIVEIKGRGHSLTIDDGWREVADTARLFVQRFVSPPPAC